MKKLAATLLAWGLPGLFAMTIFDGAGLPIPGGVDALVMYLSSQRPAEWMLVALIAVIGSTIGNSIMFFIARKGGEIYLERHTLHAFGRKLRAWFQHYGMVAVFIAALVPLPVMPMKIFTICSGALGTPVRAFMITFFCARIIRYLGLAYLGSEMGDHALDYVKSHVWQMVGLSVILFLILFAIVKVADYRKAKAQQA